MVSEISDSNHIIDESDDSEIGDTPEIKDIDPYLKNIKYRVLYQTNNYMLSQLRDMMSAENIINLSPEYQRRLRWTR